MVDIPVIILIPAIRVMVIPVTPIADIPEAMADIQAHMAMVPMAGIVDIQAPTAMAATAGIADIQAHTATVPMVVMAALD